MGAARASQTVGVDDRLPDEATALFREDPERFVAARDALVADLRAQGRPDDAAAVKALRRPTAAVWALNQLSDRAPEALRALLDAGAELRAAQRATLSSSSSGAERLRMATATRRGVVSRLVEVAGDLLEGAGRGVRPDEISAALEAASVDEGTGARLAGGTLTRPPEQPSGFGDVFGLTALDGGGGGDDERPRAEPDDAAGPADGGRRRPGGSRAEDDRSRARDEIAGLRRDRDAAARRAKTARDTAERLANRLEGMRERLAAAEAEHAEADARARGAEMEATRAERALAAAARRLERLPDADA